MEGQRQLGLLLLLATIVLLFMAYRRENYLTLAQYEAGYTTIQPQFQGDLRAMIAGISV